jgi:hypothetical protein
VSLTGALTATEELFVALGMAAKFGGLATPPPVPLRGGVALGAAVRIAWAVAPTQSTARMRTLPRLFGSDGRTAYVPLRFVDVDPVDLEVLGDAAAALGRSLLPGSGSGDVAALLDQHARGHDTTAGALVVQLARLHGLLDLAWTEDVELLHARLTVESAVDVVLTRPEEAAYWRTAERFDAMWAPGSGVARFPD